MRAMTFLPALLMLASLAQASDCGEIQRLTSHGERYSRYSLALPPARPSAVVILLAGGDGRLALNEQGCPQALEGNSLVRSVPHFHAAGLATVLLDAPSDHQAGDGLADFRASAEHAADIGQLIEALRARLGVPVWLIGTSRGAISAANAAARLSGRAAPDGLVLTSPVTVGGYGKKTWVNQTTLSVALEQIRQPLLLIAHADDRCLRSPPEQLPAIAGRSASVRQQLVTVSGGPGPVAASPSLTACLGRSPHGFLHQEQEVSRGIARFIHGSKY